MAIKPFSAGSDEDTRFLRDLQEEKLDSTRTLTGGLVFENLSLQFENYQGKQRPTLKSTTRFIDTLRHKCDVLLVEGCGGLMVPLGPRFLVSDLVASLKCPVLLVAPNRLGVINHVSLNLRVLLGWVCWKIGVVLNDVSKEKTELKRSNATFLRKSIHPKPLISLGFIEPWGRTVSGGKKCFKNVKISLALPTGFESRSESSEHMEETANRKYGRQPEWNRIIWFHNKTRDLRCRVGVANRRSGFCPLMGKVFVFKSTQCSLKIELRE